MGEINKEMNLLYMCYVHRIATEPAFLLTVNLDAGAMIDEDRRYPLLDTLVLGDSSSRDTML